jgi:hypothetical protein
MPPRFNPKDINKAGLERLLIKLAFDESVRANFASDPASTAQEFGLDPFTADAVINRKELRVLQALDAAQQNPDPGGGRRRGGTGRKTTVKTTKKNVRKK